MTRVRFILLTLLLALAPPSAAQNIFISNVVVPITPQGRLTLTSATPVLSGTVSGATAVIYTPYVGPIVPIFDGTNLNPTPCAEISNTLANSSTGSAGPFAAADNAVYDLYVWNNAGTCTLTRSDLWQQTATVTNTNASPAVFTHNGHGLLNGSPVRLICIGGGALSPNFTAGTTYYVVASATNTYQLSLTVGGAAINAGGASTCVTSQQATEGIGIQTLTTNTPARGTANTQTRQNGILLNTSAFANGPGASRGTFVGTIATNASGTVDYIFGGNATAGSFLMWNAYNRVTTISQEIDTAASYSYTSSTVRQAGGRAANQHSFVQGLQEDGASCSYIARAQDTSAVLGSTTLAACQLNSTTTFPGQPAIFQDEVAVSTGATLNHSAVFQPGLGANTITANEQGDNSNAFTLNNSSLNTLTVRFRN